MTTPSKEPSKSIPLTPVERDAARYRALRRLFGELKAALQLGDVTAVGAPALDHACDEATTVETIADVLIESTHPSLSQLSTAPIEESCVQATREIAAALERGIYQPLMPLDAQHLRACARLAEQMQQATEQATHTVQREAKTLQEVSEALARATMEIKARDKLLLAVGLWNGGVIRYDGQVAAEIDAEAYELLQLKPKTIHDLTIAFRVVPKAKRSDA
jgi:hypothetical protein